LIQRFAALSPRPATEELARLTTREHEVLRHVACGKSNAEIARDLSIEGGTVKTEDLGASPNWPDRGLTNVRTVPSYAIHPA
jgi:FixJ family two-component response regulator